LRRVGLCGQASSDRLEFAAFLRWVGIDSTSISPDFLAGVARRPTTIAQPRGAAVFALVARSA
jgi:phosphoenolpyruvate synthase/pyruvate phosphate dikinase